MDFLTEFSKIANKHLHTYSLEEISNNKILEKIGVVHADTNRDKLIQCISTQLSNILQGSKIKKAYFYDACTFYRFQFYRKESVFNKNSLKCIEIIRDHTREIQDYTKDPAKWVEAIEIINIHLSLGFHNPIETASIYSREKALADAYTQLEKKGLQPTIKDTNIYFDSKTHDKIGCAISFRLKRTGFLGFENILNNMEGIYDEKTDRHYFNRISESPLTPWGLLLKISIKHKQRKKEKIRCRASFEEALDIAKSYSTILDTQTYSLYQDLNIPREKIIDSLQKAVLCDQIYSITQFPLNQILNLIEGVFSNIKLSDYEIHWTVRDFILISREIMRISQHKIKCTFTEKQITKNLNSQVNPIKVEVILNLLSHRENKFINKNYNTPFDAKECDFNFKPLFIEKSGHYSIYKSNLFSFGFYEVISSELRIAGLKESKVGTHLEEFIESLLKKSNVKYISNAEYNINKEMKRTLETSRGNGECDFIIETSDTVIFIELKKKILTRNSQGGKVLSILIDLTKSFIESQIQSNWHEIIMKKYGKITFKSGHEIYLKDRNVEKISLSAFDYMSLHDSSILQHTIQNLLGQSLEVMSEDPGDQQKIQLVNKSLETLSKQYSFEEIITNRDLRSSLFSCRFFNIFQFMTLLNNTNSENDFKDEIWETRHISTGQKDWFQEYRYMKKLRSNKNK